ncbi:MAG: 3-dehydroquinate synthase [Treponema sp.]|jgi:3-dehydroquinate synthase|nr:3-dehydroquinate synthase [Treponema sp.]
MPEQIFTFGTIASKVCIQEEIPLIETLLEDTRQVLIVCDENTRYIAERAAGGWNPPRCVLKSGEERKNWASVETILRAAMDAGLGRDGAFVGVGGGVVGDATAFAASVYMRGARLALMPTTLLAMVDAAVGGKTGFDLFGVKNLVGTFYPASLVVMPVDALKTLPPKEFKSGMAELVKTAILDENDDFLIKIEGKGMDLVALIVRSIEIKGRIVEEDPRETGKKRALLNLGHTFGHALEAAVGLGTLTHGEAVAWGVSRACALGQRLGLTPSARAERITALLRNLGYETGASHPLLRDKALFMRSLLHDKKKRTGRPSFVVPTERGAALASVDNLGSIEDLIDAAP